LLAATAALLDRNPERAQVFLKRFSKRYFAGTTGHLLRGLTLAQEGKLGLARAVLEDHGLARRLDSFWAFPAGWTRQEWLFQEHDRIFARDKVSRRKRVAPNGGRRSAGASTSRPSGSITSTAAPLRSRRSATKSRSSLIRLASRGLEVLAEQRLVERLRAFVPLSCFGQAPPQRVERFVAARLGRAKPSVKHQIGEIASWP
jgi:hypothetical protein